jgi:hypothetical protein
MLCQHAQTQRPYTEGLPMHHPHPYLLDADGKKHPVHHGELMADLHGHYQAWLYIETKAFFQKKPPNLAPDARGITHSIFLGVPLHEEKSDWMIPMVLRRCIQRSTWPDGLSLLLLQTPLSQLASQCSDRLWVACDAHTMLHDLLTPAWPFRIQADFPNASMPYWRQGHRSDACLLQAFLDEHQLHCLPRWNQDATLILQPRNAKAIHAHAQCIPLKMQHMLRATGIQHHAQFDGWLPVQLGQAYAYHQTEGVLMQCRWAWQNALCTEKPGFQTHMILNASKHLQKKHRKHSNAFQPALERVALKKEPTQKTMQPDRYPCQHRQTRVHSPTPPHYVKKNGQAHATRTPHNVDQQAHPQAVLAHHDARTPANILGFMPQTTSLGMPRLSHNLVQLETQAPKAGLTLKGGKHARSQAWNINNSKLTLRSDTLLHYQSKRITHQSSMMFRLKTACAQHEHHTQQIQCRDWIQRVTHSSWHTQKQRVRVHKSTHVIKKGEAFYGTHEQKMHLATLDTQHSTHEAEHLQWEAQQRITLQCGAASIVLDPHGIRITGSDIQA